MVKQFAYIYFPGRKCFDINFYKPTINLLIETKYKNIS